MARSTKEKITGAALTACRKTIGVFSIAIGASDNSSTMLETAVTKTIAYFGGRDLEPNEIEFVTDGIAADRDWNADTTKSRKSQIRKVLRAVNIMPQAIVAFRKASPTRSCGWHSAVKLAGEVLNWEGSKGQRCDAAVAALLVTKPKADPKTMTASKAKAEVAKLVARIHKFKKVAGAFHGALDDLCEEHGIS